MTNSFHQTTLTFALCLYTMGSISTKISSRGRGSCLRHSTSHRSQNLCRSRRLDHCNLRQLPHSRRQLRRCYIVLQRYHDNRLVLKMKKSWIGTNVVTFIGYEVKAGSWGLSQAAKTLFQLPRSRCKVSSVQQTSSTPIFLIMLNGPPHCTNVLLLASTGHYLLGSKITRPSLKSPSHPYRWQLLFISLIIIYHGLSALMPLIVLWVLYCTTVARLTMVSLRAV